MKERENKKSVGVVTIARTIANIHYLEFPIPDFNKLIMMRIPLLGFLSPFIYI